VRGWSRWPSTTSRRSTRSGGAGRRCGGCPDPGPRTQVRHAADPDRMSFITLSRTGNGP
jgi:hypothetical protein